MKWALQFLILISASAQTIPPMPPPLDPSTNPVPVNFAWDASASSNVTGYALYWGPQSRFYTNSIRTTNLTATLPLSRAITNHIAATAFDIARMESDFSNEVIYKWAPGPHKTNFVITLISEMESATNIFGPWTPTNMSLRITNPPWPKAFWRQTGKLRIQVETF